jgi:hypothetical protein
MLFSDQFNIPLTGTEDWFDPILDDDTLLFVDPFLVYLDNQGPFYGAYDKIMAFFSKVFVDAANTPRNLGSPRLAVLTSLVVFKEPKEACLGYSVGSVNGAGAGSGFAKIIISAVYDSINAGIGNLSHFEELGIFSSNIKEDRISDITINILKQEFIAYTQQVCSTLGIAMRNLPCRIFDPIQGRWTNRPFLLPKNPYNGGPVILLPKKFLASINALNSDDFSDFCWIQYDDNIRDQFNVDLKSKMDKASIVDMARQNPDWVNSYLQFKQDQRSSAAYDLESDPNGVYRWYKATERFAKDHPLDFTVTDQPSYIRFLDEVANLFEAYVEQNDGYLMLLNDSSRPKREKAAQLLLYGIIKHYCAEIGCHIEIKEPGKGLVSFRFSATMIRDAMMEIKYVKNSGMRRTLEGYLRNAGNGDQIVLGFYFVVAFKKDDLQRGLDMEEEILEMANEHNFNLKYKVLDASIS